MQKTMQIEHKIRLPHRVLTALANLALQLQNCTDDRTAALSAF
uniref:Uncharacterized protein n=1 Tax=Arundo donax TaxID=35708 RepID=A0A0A9FRQ3_ARUDO